MAISNLLTLTVRKNQNYEPEAMSINQVYGGTANSIAAPVSPSLTDSVSLNGRVMDIMGTLTDEQIEAVFKVGYNTAVNQMIDIITTCSDISDKELIDMFLGKTNPTSAPTRLRIIRPERQAATDAANEAEEAANKAEEYAKQAEDNANEAENKKGATPPDYEGVDEYVKKAEEAAEKAREEAEKAREKADQTKNIENAGQDAIDKANDAKERADRAEIRANVAEAQAQKLKAWAENYKAQQLLEEARKQIKIAEDTTKSDEERKAAAQAAIDAATGAKRAANNSKTAAAAARTLADAVASAELATEDQKTKANNEATQAENEAANAPAIITEADEIIERAKNLGFDLQENDDEPEENKTVGPEKPSDSDVNVTLKRKSTSGSDNCKRTISVDSTVKNIKLTNTFDGKDYYYQVSTLSGTHNITLEYLDNGRLLIMGDYVKVVAIDGQNDEIILIGQNNEIDTNSGKDKIRVGNVKDSNIDDAAQSDNNKIITGSGNDYVQIFGLNNIDMGAGNNDRLLVTGGTINDYGSITKTGVEYIYSDREYILPSDNTLDWGMQGQYGDCTYMSFLNSFRDYLKRTGKNLSEYVSITGSGTNYTVKFLKSDPVQTKTITASDLGNSSNSDGDIDNVLMEIAFRKILEDTGFHMNETGDSSKSLGSNANIWLISKYIFGQNYSVSINQSYEYEDGSEFDNSANFKNQFKSLFNAYMNGEISNIILGTSGTAYDNERNGIVGKDLSGHAYYVKGGVEDKYVELTNPWDGNDSFRIDWDDIFKYFGGANLYGDAAKYAIDNNFTYIIKATPDNFNVINTIGISNNGLSLNAIMNYNGINYSQKSNPFANIFAESEPTIYDEIDEITSSIENVKEILEEKKTFELFS